LVNEKNRRFLSSRPERSEAEGSYWVDRMDPSAALGMTKKRPAYGALVAEEPSPLLVGDHEQVDPGFPADLDGLRVLDGTAGGQDGLDPGFAEDLGAVGEREERIAVGRRAADAVAGVLGPLDGEL